MTTSNKPTALIALQNGRLEIPPAARKYLSLHAQAIRERFIVAEHECVDLERPRLRRARREAGEEPAGDRRARHLRARQCGAQPVDVAEGAEPAGRGARQQHARAAGH